MQSTAVLRSCRDIMAAKKKAQETANEGVLAKTQKDERYVKKEGEVTLGRMKIGGSREKEFIQARRQKKTVHKS